ncbi:efflux RND transporter periplasmic adaptor subunit [Rubrivivax gelatinosus]|uniref:efflux RND transporter periplasmic adaptor subunit n=2 Tax=Rubrivivax gelatinosus TaxID=28068 RepID=UPI00031D7ACB|nr:efflux RND transporter periplasmic adaptor subunit [Rubrivivax gelatinosus]MBG6082664.1 RND family efflux transporter MFP subunit [Rubrivivax gelatinosus]
MRSFFVIPVAALLAVAALSACSRHEAPPEPVRAVRTVVLAQASAGGVQEYAAEVQARTESQLGFRVAGKLVRRQAEVGRHVAAGELLAQLDPQDLRLAQTAAQATMRSAQVNAEMAAADFKRFRELYEQGFISAAELDRRETTLKAARAQFEQARAEAGVQANQAAYSDLHASAAGIVTAVMAEPGAVLAAGTPVLRLAHDGPRDVVFAVPEDEVGRMRSMLGRPGAVRVRLWGRQDTMPATVREVAAAADAATRTFTVKADVGAGAAQLGQTASVLIEQPRVEGVAKLPLTAVVQVQGKTSVWVLDRATMTVRPQPVELGGTDGNSVVVASGLAPGAVVVTAGVHVLAPGQKVRLYEDTKR